MSAVELEINDDHPLAFELTSLRVAVARFQHEAHTSALKLQRHSLESTLALERAQVFERDNTAVRAELAALHAHPDITPHPATLQVQELTIALRRVSDKLTLTEDTLLTRTTELAGALGDAARAKRDVESAYALAASTRAREEEGKARERNLLRRARAAEEERRMIDRAVQEYADLVRNLERRQSIAPPTPNSADLPNGKPRSSATLPVDTLREGRAGLQKLLEEFSAETEKLEAEIGRLHGDLKTSEAQREAERKAAEQDHVLLAHARAELDKLKNDDSAAAKMVSRYMKFSQSTTDALQRALDNLKIRHGATTSTLHQRISTLESSLASERRQSDRLRDVLDELTEQLARESYGRRREISLRLAVVGREDGLAEALRRWVRRARETLERSDHEEQSLREHFQNVVKDAVQLLGMVDGDDEVGSGTKDRADHGGMGSVARILAAQDAVKILVEELQVETEKRMQIERLLGRAVVDKDGTVVPPPPPIVHDPGQAAIAMVADSVSPSRIDAATSPIPPPPSLAPDPNIPEVSNAGPIFHVPPVQTNTDDSHLITNSIPLVTTLANIVEVHQPSPRLPQDSPAFATLQNSPALTPRLPDSLIVFPSSSSSSAPDHSPLTVPTRGAEAVSGCASDLPPPALPSIESQSTHSPPQSPEGPPVLAELARVKNRYDALQRAFRDCHLALRDLKQTLPTIQSSSSIFPLVLQTALFRLDDFNEDARVELEIRVADEERISRGYTTLLSVPGAITSAGEAAEVERAVHAFVEGTDASVARALTQFQRKLDDLEHDVAAVKLAVHSSPDATERPSTPERSAGAGASWTSLAAGFFTPSRPASPAPTFGSVMTSPRLRHAPSFHRAHTPSIDVPPPNPFAALDLRIPMPEHLVSLSPSPSSGMRPPVPRARTTSGMYMLGLGMRSAPFVGAAAGAQPARRSVSSPLHTPKSGVSSADARPSVEEGDDGEETEDMDSDIE